MTFRKKIDNNETFDVCCEEGEGMVMPKIIAGHTDIE